MSEKLEALERIRETLYREFNFPFNLTEEYKVLRKAFIPPTSDEVCKALTLYYKKPIIYNNKVFSIQCSNGEYVLIKLHDNNELEINPTYCLSPTLLILVCRFYESLVK